MSDLMLEIIMCVILMVVITFGTLLLFLIVYDYLMTNVKKKELKKYVIGYAVNEIKGFGCVKAKNKKQAIKKFRRYYFYIFSVKEIE